MVSVGDQEVAVNAAIGEARASLPEFWRRFEAASDRSVFLLKVGVDVREGTREHLWVNDLVRDPLEGALCNEPKNLPGMRARDRLRFVESQITDWAYMTEQGDYGHFTTRALIPFMNKRQAVEVGATFAPTPIQTDD